MRPCVSNRIILAALQSAVQIGHAANMYPADKGIGRHYGHFPPIVRCQLGVVYEARCSVMSPNCVPHSIHVCVCRQAWADLKPGLYVQLLGECQCWYFLAIVEGVLGLFLAVVDWGVVME